MKTFDRLGIIAGEGSLPKQVVQECIQKHIEPFVVVMRDFAKTDDYNSCTHMEARFGDVGKVISFFRRHNVKNVIFAGGVKKPSLTTVKPDIKGLFLLARLLKSKLFGDNTVLQVAIDFAESEGFTILSVDEIAQNIKIDCGCATNTTIANKKYYDDIDLGVKVLKAIGALDIGQSVVVQNGMILGIECIEGTMKLIERCGELKYTTGRKPVLVKIKKTEQTRKVDLPAIGEDTIIQLSNAGFAGIALDYKNGLVINRDKTINTADKNRVFIYGIEV